MNIERQYSNDMLDSMQTVYGHGFLSPGGATEVRQLLANIPVAGKDVLDLGCGVGGACLLIASEFGARHVVGADVEQDQLNRAGANVVAAGLEERISLLHIDPLAVDFGGRMFDIVITKDVICHAEDKARLFSQVHAAMRPGGVFANADWTTAHERAGDIFVGWQGQLEAAGLKFWFETATAYQEYLAAAGFGDIEARDHTAWSTEGARDQLARSQREGRQESIKKLGEASHERRSNITETRLRGLECGQIEHWHIIAHT